MQPYSWSSSVPSRTLVEPFEKAGTKSANCLAMESVNSLPISVPHWWQIGRGGTKTVNFGQGPHSWPFEKDETKSANYFWQGKVRNTELEFFANLSFDCTFVAEFSIKMSPINAQLSGSLQNLVICSLPTHEITFWKSWSGYDIVVHEKSRQIWMPRSQMSWKTLEKFGLEPTAPNRPDGDLAESIKRSASDRLGDLVP